MKRINGPTWITFIVVLYVANFFASINIGRIRAGVCRAHFSIRYVLIRNKTRRLTTRDIRSLVRKKNVILKSIGEIARDEYDLCF